MKVNIHLNAEGSIEDIETNAVKIFNALKCIDEIPDLGIRLVVNNLVCNVQKSRR